MTKLIKLNELVNALEPGETTEYGNITSNVSLTTGIRSLLETGARRSKTY